ncbi:MAG: peptidylprolyl isomerase [Pseudonocardiales bacterium]|nr:MAG: peptidylprolyl isomerase [Pseudonocardiales bacterium]
MRATKLLAVATGTVLIVGLATAAAAAAGGSSGGSLGPAPKAPHAAPASTRCVYTPVVPKDRYKGLPPYHPAQAKRPYVAKLYTTQGEIDFRALTTKAPCTTNSFAFLARHAYFTGTHCHRLTTRRIYVLQCGDPTGTGSGGPGYEFGDENLKGATYPAGTVAMANAGPNTNGSQFFITTKDTTLSPAYTPFGVVTRGMGILRSIAAAGDDSQNGPGDGYPHKFVQFSYIAIALR